MRISTNSCLIALLLAGFFGGALEARPLPAPLDQEEYLDAEDWFQAGLVSNSAGNYQAAAEAFSRSIAIDPENALTWLNLGTAQALLGDYGAAIDAMQKSVHLDPKLAIGFANLGEVYFRTERFPEALRAYTALLALQPGDGNAHYKSGLAYLILNDAGRAQAEYLTLKILDPDLAAKLLRAIDQSNQVK